jgi:hypothetical protein
MDDCFRWTPHNVPGLRADELTRQDDTMEELKSIAREIVMLIDEQIVAARKAGKDTMQYTLPHEIGITKLSKEDAQLLLYSDLLRIYELKGFKVVLGEKRNARILVISWRGEISAAERQMRLKYIMSKHMNEKKKGI